MLAKNTLFSTRFTGKNSFKHAEIRIFFRHAEVQNFFNPIYSTQSFNVVPYGIKWLLNVYTSYLKYVLSVISEASRVPVANSDSSITIRVAIYRVVQNKLDTLHLMISSEQ